MLVVVGNRRRRCFRRRRPHRRRRRWWSRVGNGSDNHTGDQIQRRCPGGHLVDTALILAPVRLILG